MNKIRFKDIKIAGFSLAEMLIVMATMSFIIVAIIPFAGKKMSKGIIPVIHGRFECFYDDSNTLTQYFVTDKTEAITTYPTDGVCRFTPPAKTAFFIIQAVGGGGGGAYGGEPSKSTTYYNGNIYYPCYYTTSSYSTCTQSNYTMNYNYSGTQPSSRPWLTTAWENHPPRATYTLCSTSGTGGRGDAIIVIDNDCINDTTCNENNISGCTEACITTRDFTGGQGGYGACSSITPYIYLGGNFSRQTYSLSYKSGNYEQSVTLGQIAGVTDSHFHTNGLPPERVGNNMVDGLPGEDMTCNLTSFPYESTTTCEERAKPGGAGGIGMYRNAGGTFSYNYGSSGVGRTWGVSPTNLTWREDYWFGYNRYGHGGEPGEFITQFFPVVTNSLEMTIGMGGAGAISSTQLGQPGTDTIIKTADGETVLIAKGGYGGTSRVQKDPFRLTAQDPVSGVTNSPKSASKDSGFITFSEMDSRSKTPSLIEKLGYKVGKSGAGGFTILRDTNYTDTYTFNGLNVTYLVDENSKTSANPGKLMPCPTVAGSTTAGTYCPASNGHPGGISIVW